MAWRVCLHTWTTLELALRTGKHTSAIWSFFFNALATDGLAINLEKCVFAPPSLEILGHMISAMGAAPTADHAAKIKNCPPPSGYQTATMLSWHGKLLPPFFAKLCSSPKTFD